MNSTECNLPVTVVPTGAPLDSRDPLGPLDPAGRTVGQVADEIGRRLRRAEIEPEWVIAANFVNSGPDLMKGLTATSPWPLGADQGHRRRFCISVESGYAEGWLVQIDYVCLHQDGDEGYWSSLPLVRIKTLTRSRAWTVAAVVSRMLEID